MRRNLRRIHRATNEWESEDKKCEQEEEEEEEWNEKKQEELINGIIN